MDSSNEAQNRLRSALFGAAEDPSPSDRVLAKTNQRMRKITSSDLGHPNGRRSISFGR